MKSEARTVEEYIENLPENRKETISRLREIVKSNLPAGFEEVMNYGTIGYVVPISKYPAGYHAGKNQPLPFVNIASQKNHIAIYHLGLYSDKELLTWFVQEFEKRSSAKLDMGKSCIRFRKPEHIPFDLIAELMRKITVEKWIEMYENSLTRRQKREED